MATSGGVPYLGSRIMLISKKEIRYEGILYTIDSAASTVALQNVRSFGTEDRLPDNPVPGNDQVFDYIIFRGSDIKDLHVCEEEGTAPAPPPATSMPAAAPEPTAPSVAAPSVAAPSAGPSVASPKKPAPAWGANPSATRAAAQPTAAAAPPASRAATGATRGGRVQPGNGAHMSSRASRGVGGGKGGGNMEQAFDFEKMLAGFDKIAMEREAAKKVKSTEYDKTSSFFDTLDEQVDEKRKGGRVFMAEMRKVDALTFGEELIRQRGRGGGKGGKGLARGNGRDGGRGAMGQKGNGKGAGRGGVRTNGGGKGGDRRPRNTDVDTFGDMARTSGRARDGRSGRAGDGGRGGARGGGRGQAAVATGAAPVPPVVPASA